MVLPKLNSEKALFNWLKNNVFMEIMDLCKTFFFNLLKKQK